MRISTIRTRTIAAKLAAALAVLVTTVTLSVGGGGTPAGATVSNSDDLVWGLFGSGPYVCTTQVIHAPGFGGALAATVTPDPIYRIASCWSTYSITYATGGSAESDPGDPNSAAWAPGVPVESDHLACFGVFDCAGSWYYLP